MIKVGKTVELECMDTPGHTMCHICLRSHGDEPALFSGDTLFNAGAGNCHNGGNPEDLYATFVDQLAKLPDGTRVYPGHDYIENNLRFTLAREPDNAAANEMLPRVSGQDPATARVTTLAEEKRINTFLRLTQPERDREAARGVSRSARATRREDGVRQAQGAAQPLVAGASARPARHADPSGEREGQGVGERGRDHADVPAAVEACETSVSPV